MEKYGPGPQDLALQMPWDTLWRSWEARTGKGLIADDGRARVGQGRRAPAPRKFFRNLTLYTGEPLRKCRGAVADTQPRLTYDHPRGVLIADPLP
jgi:hypothetical protein